jgi:hypothetical protein
MEFLFRETVYCSSGRYGAVPGYRGTRGTRGTDYCRADDVIGHCAAVDVVRSTANSSDYCRAGGIISRCAAGSALSWTVCITQINSVCKLWSSLHYTVNDYRNCWSLSAPSNHPVFCCPWRNAPSGWSLFGVCFGLYLIISSRELTLVLIRLLCTFCRRMHVSLKLRTRGLSRAGNYFVRAGLITIQRPGILPFLRNWC